MLGRFVIFVLILVEIAFAVFSLVKKSDLKKEKSIVRIALFIIFILLVVSPIIEWNFRWFMLGLFLLTQAIFGMLFILKAKDNSTAKKSKIIFSTLNRVFLMTMLVIPAIILPQYAPINPTGEYNVGTVSYTLTDESRKEYFTPEDDYRSVTMQLWYPLEQLEQEKIDLKSKFPLVVFSHGAFGYRMSNYSTFQELASQGYTVCSIDHTYHAFMTKQEGGQIVIGNMEFMNKAMQAQNGELGAEEIYKLQQDWMELRTGDMEFVLDFIKNMAMLDNSDAVFQAIDLKHIGVVGHSLGGATAAQLGRDDEDVDAVIVIDGTMLGEIAGFENGKEIISDIPYPKPIMNIYNETHYNEAMELKDSYANMIAAKNAVNSYEVVVKESGHINFTDLPMVSPFLSKLLGTGDVDARYCIETTNEVILQFFDNNLKSSNVAIAKERIF